MMKETSTTMASRMTKATTAESSMIQQPLSMTDQKEIRHKSQGSKQRYMAGQRNTLLGRQNQNTVGNFMQ